MEKTLVVFLNKNVKKDKKLKCILNVSCEQVK